MDGVPGSKSLRDAAQKYLQACFSRETAPRASELAQNMGLTPSALTNVFKAVLGVTPSEYLKNARIAEAKRLLATTALSATEIAYRSGFGTRRTFFRAFHRAAGMTPEEFRRAV